MKADQNTTPSAHHPENTPQPTPPQPAALPPANGLAIAALVVGIVGLVSGWIPVWGILVGVAAVILGVFGLKKAGGKAMAIIGIVGGGLAVLWSLLVTFFLILAIVAGTMATNEAANRQQAQVEQQENARKDFAKGEIAQFGNFAVKVNSVTRNYTPSNQSTNSSDEREIIVINVTVTNKGDTVDWFSEYTLSLAENNRSTAVAIIPGLENKFIGKELSPGESETGAIAYRVTKGATDLKLQYKTTLYKGGGEREPLVYSLAL